MARLRRGDQRTGFIDRLTDDVHDAAEALIANRHHDRRAGIDNDLAANETFGGVHGDGAHGIFTEMLRHFENQAIAAIVGFQRVQDRRQMTFLEGHVDNGADDLAHLALRAGAELHRSRLGRRCRLSRSGRLGLRCRLGRHRTC